MPAPQIFKSLLDRELGFPRGQFKLAEWTAEPSPDSSPRMIAPLHVHYKDDEAWYILEGTIGFHVGKRKMKVKQGAALFVPRGTPHTYWNPTHKPARYLLITTPKIFKLIEEFDALEKHTNARLKTIFAKYDSEIL
jgi:mannose-6-phosphate isomerase-like protein (cupin superfamily)